MKPYLSVFLLLLINQSIWPTAGLSIGPVAKGFTKGLIKGGRKALIDDLVDYLKNITHNSSPSQPDAPPELIKGTSHIKDYLSNYGYIQSSGPFNDSLDQETRSAIKDYQQYFNLQVTGELDNQTLKQMSFLRCGVPDTNFDYNFNDNNVSYPKAGHKWFPNTNLTYGFLRASQIPPNATKVFRDSFKRWAKASGVLNLTETTYDNADIQVGFYNFTYFGIDVEVYGCSLIFLRPDSSKTGELLLDGTMFWALPSDNVSAWWWEYGILDLESVAMHQIGHLLGLDHSNDSDSVMYPYILPSQQRKVQLSDSDKDNIQQQYTNVNSGDGGRSGVLLITTFSLGFVYVLLLLY